jgi:hypothetical protein
MRRSLELLAAAALLAAPASAQPGPPPVPPAGVLAAAGDCRALPGAYEAAVRYVLAHGWTVMSRPGAETVTYHRGLVGLLLNAAETGPGDRTGCMVMATIDPQTRWEDLVAAGSAAFGGAPNINQDGATGWEIGGKTIAMIRQGERQEILTVIVVPD